MKTSRPSQNLDLNLLKVFVVTYHERNLKRAAKRLASTAPSVSVKLARLSDRIGGKLFFKTPAGFEPTDLADRLFEKVDPLLSGLTETIDFIDAFDPAYISSPIIMDIGQNLMPWLAPVLHDKIQGSCPDSHLIANYFTDRSFERLRKGEVGIGLQLKALEAPKDIWEVPVGTLEMGAIVRKDHPFQGNEAKLKDILGYDFAAIEQSFSELGKGGHFLQSMEQQNVPLKIKFRCPSVYTICEILKRTDMVLPTSLNLLRYRSSDLRAIRITDYQEYTTMQVHAYLHQKNRHSEKHLWFLELLKEEFV